MSLSRTVSEIFSVK